MNILIKIKENVLLGSAFFITLGAAVSMIISLILTLLHLSGNGAEINDLYNNDHVLMLVATVFVIPAIEELLFRFLLYKQLLRKLIKAGPYPGSLIAGIVFGLLHNPIPAMITGFITGTTLCLIYEKSGRLLYSICCHAGFNMMSYLMLLVM